ncbi:PREDICTED: agamous-like MADS-box protein AGL80 [Camelina sativa]|uniref:Agamous-like MADS-box protein AGL80 n=1 Tax=Camelina sativa TaxID=90675 RepID=A0ABM0V8M1_CAMSA|nr:PREDICTED: agamous-like MADS-box protein AGL80 [Camelina sativa]
MGKRKTPTTWANEKARRLSLEKRLAGLVKKTKELSILCDMRACLVVYDREVDQLEVWPAPQTAKSLFDKFYSLTDHERNMKAVDPESFIQTNIQKLEKKIADTRKAITEIEMDNLMLELSLGRPLADLSPTEIDKLLSYTGKKIMCLRKEMGSAEQLDMSVDEESLGDATLRASNVPSAGWGGNVMETGSMYYFDQWGSADPEVQEPSDETHLPTMVTGMDLNMEPAVGDKNLVGTSKGESSKAAAGAEDDAE